METSRKNVEKQEMKALVSLYLFGMVILGMVCLSLNFAYGQTSSYGEATYVSSIYGTSYSYGGVSTMQVSKPVYVSTGYNVIAQPTAISSDSRLSERELNALVDKHQEKIHYALFIGFDGVKVAKVDNKNDSIISAWETSNYAYYSTNDTYTKFSYEEYDHSNKCTKKYTHTIVSHTQDSEVHTLQVKSADDGGVYSVIIWKDGSMVALQNGPYTYLVTGEYEILKM